MKMLYRVGSGRFYDLKGKIKGLLAITVACTIVALTMVVFVQAQEEETPEDRYPDTIAPSIGSAGVGGGLYSVKASVSPFDGKLRLGVQLTDNKGGKLSPNFALSFNSDPDQQLPEGWRTGENPNPIGTGGKWRHNFEQYCNITFLPEVARWAWRERNGAYALACARRTASNGSLPRPGTSKRVEAPAAYRRYTPGGSSYYNTPSVYDWDVCYTLADWDEGRRLECPDSKIRFDWHHAHGGYTDEELQPDTVEGWASIISLHPGESGYTEVTGRSKYKFDSNGLLERINVGDHSGQLTMHYAGEEDQRLESVRSNLGKELSFDYEEGLLTVVHSPSGDVNLSYEFGNLDKIQMPNGRTINFGYEDGRLISYCTKEARAGGASEMVYVHFVYEEDALGKWRIDKVVKSPHTLDEGIALNQVIDYDYRITPPMVRNRPLLRDDFEARPVGPTDSQVQEYALSGWDWEEYVRETGPCSETVPAHMHFVRLMPFEDPKPWHVTTVVMNSEGTRYEYLFDGDGRTTSYNVYMPDDLRDPREMGWGAPRWSEEYEYKVYTEEIPRNRRYPRSTNTVLTPIRRNLVAHTDNFGNTARFEYNEHGNRTKKINPDGSEICTIYNYDNAYYNVGIRYVKEMYTYTIGIDVAGDGWYRRMMSAGGTRFNEEQRPVASRIWKGPISMGTPNFDSGDYVGSTVMYNGLGMPREVIDAEGRRTNITYNEDGTVHTVAYQEGVPGSTRVEFTDYTPAGIACGARIFKGGRRISEVTTLLDPLNRPIELIYEDGTESINYDLWGVKSAVDKEGNVSEVLERDWRGLPLRVEYRSADGTERLVSETRYDNSGRVIYTKTPGGKEGYGSYDWMGRLDTVRRRGGASGDIVTSYAYGTGSPTTEVTVSHNGKEISSVTTRDCMMRPEVSKLLADGQEIRKVVMRDPLGRVKSSTVYSGEAWRPWDWSRSSGEVDYNFLGQVEESTDLLGLTTDYSYTDGGSPEKVEGPASIDLQSSVVYDALGRPETTFAGNSGDPNYVSSSVSYSNDGLRQTATDPMGNTTTAIVDRLGRWAEAIDAKGTKFRSEYDIAGRLKKLIFNADAEPEDQQVTEYEHDGLGRQVRTIYPDGMYASCGYLIDGEVDWVRSRKGDIFRFRYGGLGELKQIIDESRIEDSVLYEYDDLMNVSATENGIIRCELTRDHPFGLVTETKLIDKETGEDYVTSYDYNYGMELTSVTYPSGVKVEYEFDPVTGRLERIKTSEDSPVEVDVGYHYDPLTGFLTGMTYGNGITTGYGFDDPLKRLSRIEHVPSEGEALSTHNYVYNRLSNIRLDDGYNAGERYEKRMSYDELSQLVDMRVATEDERMVYSWSFDDLGNRLSCSERNFDDATAEPQNSIYESNDMNQYTSITGTGGDLFPLYDPNGNLVRNGGWAYDYDSSNNLIKVSKLAESRPPRWVTVAEYRFGFGRNIEIVNGKRTFCVIDPMTGQVFEEWYNGEIDDGRMGQIYVWGPGTNNLLAMITVKDGEDRLDPDKKPGPGTDSFVDKKPVSGTDSFVDKQPDLDGGDDEAGVPSMMKRFGVGPN